ncbi:MAG: formylmethanofuran dehydrogenase subunit A [Candidatus Bathyarchaeota archaeon]|nr:formylmethanofuran dehydrogenase subunit A [Candidatus Bathyarchaeota archaeon]
MSLLLKNGFVYDPLNGVNGEVMDIVAEGGKIVERPRSKDLKVIDVSGMVVMPGGVDIHSHIAGSEVNAGRLLRPEDHFKDVEVKGKVTRSGVGYSVPSTFTTGYRYSKMGYTTVMVPSMPPLEARHTHEEMDDTPMIDKAAYPLLSDWWFVLEYLRDDKIEECATHIAWMMRATKGYAIKLVNPGGLEAWGYGKNVQSIDDPVPNFDVTPREVIRGLCKVNKILNLPHTIHVHTNNLGKPGNYLTTLKTMHCVKDLADGTNPAIHITHCQFSAFKGSDWSNMRSGAKKIARYVNRHSHVTIDLGQVVFTDTTTMTADGPFQYGLYQLSGNKWVNHDVETETSSGVVPFRYRRKSYVHATQWTIGLELALLIRSPWKVFLTTDHPNAAPFTTYPQIISWLMSRPARERLLKRINRKARKRCLLAAIEREYDLSEIAIATRAGTAKALGLTWKGHLGVDADADIAVYEVNPERVDLSKEYALIKKAFERAVYTIKGGEVVSQKGEVVKPVLGRTYWTDVKTLKPNEASSDFKQRFEDYWTVQYENYPIPERYLHSSKPIPVKAEV